MLRSSRKVTTAIPATGAAAAAAAAVLLPTAAATTMVTASSQHCSSSSSSSSHRIIGNGTSHHLLHPNHNKRKRRVAIALTLAAAVAALMLTVLLFWTTATRGAGRNNNGTFRNSPRRRAVEQQRQRQQQQPQNPNGSSSSNLVDSAATTAALDVAVVGAGPAGLTAGLFAARAGLSVVVVGSPSQGQLAEAAALDNFPSFVAFNNNNNNNGGGGATWLAQTQRQCADAGVHFAQPGLRVERILQGKKNGGDDSLLFALQLERRDPNHKAVEIPARAVVIATGAAARRLDLPHETQLWGRQVHSCAICDGNTYKDRRVVVVGGGDAAVDAALLLRRQRAASVTLVHRRTDFRASNQRNLQLLLDDTDGSVVHVKTPYVVQEYSVNARTQKLTGVVLQHADDPSRKETVPCDGVFVMIGSVPNTQFLAAAAAAAGTANHHEDGADAVTVELDASGLVVLPRNNKDNPGLSTAATTTATTVPGVFAAGEVTDPVYKQALTAAAAGAQAAIDAERWLRQQPRYSNDSNHRNNIPDNLPLQVFAATTTSKEAATPAKKDNNNNNDNDNDQNDCDLTTEACITALVQKHPVVVFSKPWCPYCKKALEALSLEGVADEPYLRVVNLLGGGMTATRARQIQTALGKMTGGRVTVPNVFVGGTSIGGGDETAQLHRRGRLRALLQAARAYPPPSLLPCENLADAACLTMTVQKYPVVVFSKNYCPHCKKALELLETEGVRHNSNAIADSNHPQTLLVIDLMAHENYSDIQDALERMTRRRTVPNIFAGGRSLGGASELENLQANGKLGGYLERARAVDRATATTVRRTHT